MDEHICRPCRRGDCDRCDDQNCTCDHGGDDDGGT